MGDRLDTDIAGANAAGLPSLLVLTGVSTAADMVFAIPEERPNYVAPDLRSLMRPARPCGSDRIRRGTSRSAPTMVTVHSTGQDAQDPLTVVRADGQRGVEIEHGRARRPTIAAGDDTARQALERWSLLAAPIG